MAFPQLQIRTDGKIITNFSLVWTDGSDIATELIRDRYDIERKLFKNSGASSFSAKDPEIRFDRVIYNYTWIGHADVDTKWLSSSPPGRDNLLALENALFVTEAVYVIDDHDEESELDGSLDVSSDNYRSEAGPQDSWKYKVAPTGETYIPTPHKWVIQKTSITDNQNGTSRLTVTLISWSPIYTLQDIIDG